MGLNDREAGLMGLWDGRLGMRRRSLMALSDERLDNDLDLDLLRLYTPFE